MSNLVKVQMQPNKHDMENAKMPRLAEVWICTTVRSYRTALMNSDSWTG